MEVRWGSGWEREKERSLDVPKINKELRAYRQFNNNSYLLRSLSVSYNTRKYLQLRININKMAQPFTDTSILDAEKNYITTYTNSFHLKIFSQKAKKLIWDII